MDLEMTCLRLDDRTCVATIDNTGPSALESWYDIWEEMVAIDGMCTSHGLEGQAFSLGKFIATVTPEGISKSCLGK